MSDYYKDTRNEYEMLKGNINRMFLTENFEELIEMYGFALVRLTKLKSFNAYRIENQVNNYNTIKNDNKTVEEKKEGKKS